MVEWLAGFSQRQFGIPSAQTRHILHVAGIVLATATFVLITTILVAYDSIFQGANNIAAVKIGEVAPQDIRAPITLASYASEVLTQQRQQEIRTNTPAVYYPPNPNVARQQADLTRQILDYIQNIRRDPFGTPEQKIADLHQITDLRLDDQTITQLLALDDITWADVSDQISGVLERVMRGEIRESSLPAILAQLPTQVSVRFTEAQSNIIVAIVKDLIRPNTLLNIEATDKAKSEASANVVVRRSFERGQIVVRAGEYIDDAAYEALSRLGLLQSTDRRLQDILHALMVSVVVLVMVGLYISRFKPSLFNSARFMALLAGLFLVTLVGVRFFGGNGQIYLYPTAALALLYVALVGPEITVIAIFALGVLIGLMQNNSLEIELYVILGGLMGALTLRRPERLNSYFMPGLMVALANTLVMIVFYPGTGTASNAAEMGALVLYSIINGILSATVALGALFIVSIVFNLPTAVKFVELSQPNQPLLQRLLREAPGTYQHSLQVANLAEQAAHTIGANADLVRVAALYHDIGKMLNAPFFTENQVEGVNPHDVLNDPARSADIIISHVTEGVKLARQYRLPVRLRDFILEHHGTQVLYFYEQAVARAGDEQAIDKDQFTYPGPKPRSRETGVLMLADSCEAAVRSRKPSNKQEIADTIQQIFDKKIREGQLDDSGLTLKDIKTIQKIFVDMLQAVFHPRIAYPASLPSGAPKPLPEPARPVFGADMTLNSQFALKAVTSPNNERKDTRTQTMTSTILVTDDLPPPQLHTKEIPVVRVTTEENDDAPLPEVPPLPRTGSYKAVKPDENGAQPPTKPTDEK